jgi:hypothetical protein
MPASAQFARPTGILHYRTLSTWSTPYSLHYRTLSTWSTPYSLHYRTLSTWSTPYSLRRTAHSESRPFGQAVPHRDAAHATLQPRPLHTQRCNRDGCNRVQPIRANATHCHNVQLRSTARLRRTGSRGDEHCINYSVQSQRPRRHKSGRAPLILHKNKNFTT